MGWSMKGGCHHAGMAVVGGVERSGQHVQRKCLRESCERGKGGSCRQMVGRVEERCIGKEANATLKRRVWTDNGWGGAVTPPAYEKRADGMMRWLGLRGVA